MKIDPIMALSAAEMLFDLAMKARAELIRKNDWTPEQEASWKAKYIRYSTSPAWQTAAEEAATQ